MGTEPEGLIMLPDRELLLDELARCFVQAAVTRLLKERRESADVVQCHSVPTEPARLTQNVGQPLMALIAITPRVRRRRTHMRARPGVKSKVVGAA